MSRCGLLILTVFFITVLSLANCFESYTNTSSSSNDQLAGSKRPFSFIWHEPFGTNISSETPHMFINESHSILSTRQYHVNDMNAYSIRYVQHNDIFFKLVLYTHSIYKMI